MNLTFEKNSGEILQFAGYVFIAGRDSTKDPRDNAVTVLDGDLSSAGTTATVKTTLGMPSTGTAFIGDNPGTESFTITSKTETLKALYGTRASSPSAHTTEEMILYKGTSGYSRFMPFGFIESMSINPGMKAKGRIYDFNGKVRGSSTELAEPTFKITGLQSGLMERALLFARDVDTTDYNGMKRMSTTALEDFAFLILTEEKNLDDGTFKYGLIRIPWAQLSTTGELPFTSEVKKLEYTFNLNHDMLVGDYIVIDMEVEA